ncbi:hypothetical protein BHE74_00021071 [Ensete ventricosum]|nr:hypothetical protein BHE74_00021071 [Ensete ventricosum]
MEAAASRSSRGFDDEDDDDQEFAKREGFFFSHKADLTIKADGKGSGTDDLQTTPRFQILRELIPHSDQKRDKASFLLEVKVYYRSFWKNAQVVNSGANQRLVSVADNMPSQAQPHWLGSSSPADCAVSSEMLNEQEELIIDEGTISASASYSQGYAPN